MAIYLGLGTNLGDREMNLVMAKDLLMKHDVLVVGQSEVRETPPLGGLDQPPYLNQVIECRTELSAKDLLAACKAVELEMGRPQKPKNLGNVQFGKPKEPIQNDAWESRIIDIDILFYHELILSDVDLIVPHPGTYDRSFVVQGLVDLNPELVHPTLKQSMAVLLENF
ncbi:MAG: 2-amino-4-hydroxy-6-hydroxymethyldihydropteridine diphosphokinase [Patescibacteria group bacterium]